MAFRSTPLREGRQVLPFKCLWSGRFDPRPCARGDRVTSSPVQLDWVSIHAPARGATANELSLRPSPMGFDPRPCARGDRAALASCHGASGFDPRPCARGDHTAHVDLDITISGFDPRPCARGDPDRYVRRRTCIRFDPRPCARGDIAYMFKTPAEVSVSIHAPARGATASS